MRLARLRLLEPHSLAAVTNIAWLEEYDPAFSNARDSRNGIYGSWAERTSPQSALMFAARITLAHFSVSSVMSVLKSADEPPRIIPPRSASCVFSLGSARPALISLLSLSTIPAGVLAGAPKPK